jgi:multimeric flavodoxin WrbA
MKVLMINGSPRKDGNTARALKEIADTLKTEGVESEIFWIGNKPVRGCAACYQCAQRDLGRCVFDDDVANRIVEKLPEADGFIIGSPTYYGQPNGALLAVWQRVCFSAGKYVKGKPAATVAICRRGGSTAAFQTMNMIFEMLSCPLVTSQYWNIAFGREPGECEQDAEGLQTMRTLARNMAWLLKSLKDNPRPEQEPWQPTHFIR